MFKGVLIFSVGFLLVSLAECSVIGYIRPIDHSRYLRILEENLLSNEVLNIHYASHGYKLLSQQLPVDKSTAACRVLQNTIKNGGLKLDSVYHLSSALKYLGTCKDVSLKDADIKIAHDTISDSSASIHDLFYAVITLKNLGKPIENGAKIAQNLQTKLKTEDTLQNLGYAFHIASNLGASGKFAQDRIEEALVQADEVDGKMLQFEGGLSVTSLLLVGIDSVLKSQNKPNVITTAQAEKFGNYLMSRRSIQSVKGVCNLLEAIKIFTDNKQLSPASISLASTGPVMAIVSIRVCDMLGKPLLSASDSVIAQSATRLGDDVVVLAKQKLVSTADSSIFNLELPRDRMAAGLYRVAISAGSHSASLTITALANGAISYLDIGVVDTDQSSPGKLQRIKYPSTLQTILDADSQQRLAIRFLFIDETTNKPFQIQQSFVRLTNVKTGQEIVYVAEQEDSGAYRADLEIGTKSADLNGESGIYNIDLILGDTVLSNPFEWKVGQINIKVPALEPEPIRRTGPKPEIHHQFREAEIRPPQFVSMLFTGLCIAPLLLLFILWFKLGVNVSNFPLSLSAIIFHVSLAGIFGLFGVFWLSLDMFQTCRWLLLLGLVTFVSGHKLLSSIAEKRKH